MSLLGRFGRAGSRTLAFPRLPGWWGQRDSNPRPAAKGEMRTHLRAPNGSAFGGAEGSEAAVSSLVDERLAALART